MTSLPYRGDRAGWLDPNTEFTPRILHGTSTTPGLLMQVRRTDDVIAPAADARLEMLREFDYKIQARPRFEEDPIARQCAIEVGSMLRSMPDRSLQWFVSETYDHWWSSGLCLYEMVLDGDRLRLAHIRPGLIQRFNQDRSGYGFDSATITTRLGGQVDLQADKIAYFARNAGSGEFWGESGVRCLLATYTTTYELYKSVLQAIQLSTGFPYSHGTGQGMPSDTDRTNILKMFNSMVAGNIEPVHLSAAVDLKMLASNAPALSQFAPLAQYQSERKHAAALNALNNLGMRGVGSRSLGEVVHDVDAKALRAHLNGFLKMLSGDSPHTGTLFRTLTELLGYAPELAPEIRIRWSDSDVKISKEHIDSLRELVRDNLLAQTPELREFIASQAGLSARAQEAQIDADQSGADDVAATEPLAVGSLTASMAALQSMASTDPSVPRLAPGAVFELLRAAGVPAESARAMIAAQQGEAP